VVFPTPDGLLYAVDAANFRVGRGEVVGVVGESGSGKSMTCRAILGLVPRPGAVVGGKLLFDGVDLVDLTEKERRKVRGRRIAMVFQDPRASLNPVFTVGHQITDVLTRRAGLSRQKAQRRALELLEQVGIPAPKKRLKAYSHELSGGMRQRVMIAVALAADPVLLIADEPTTALDVTIQDQILHLLLDIRREKNMSVLLVSHDMGVIAQTSDRVVVMYAGNVVESGSAHAILTDAHHPYTQALLRAIPRIDPTTGSELRAIPGQAPSSSTPNGGCPFIPRCDFAESKCSQVSMTLLEEPGGRLNACPFIPAR
jgi:oligopeptide/dipeptide ABC transporter ATP-binding protein